jgi:hypothetical protein
LTVAICGCNRAYYRQQADCEVEDVISGKANDSRWALSYSTITPPEDSRLFDPFDPDFTPLPPDDPTSHELMHHVDGKRGWAKWHRNGDAVEVDAGTWRQSLPYDDDGQVVLNLEQAIKVARMNSRDYQRELEDLYLSALDVTFERFRFDAQYFARNSTLYTANGPDRSGSGGVTSSQLSTETTAELHKLTATGGELVAGLANSILWQFAGPDTNSYNSLLDFSFVQPLLRFGGRARVLERLTRSERDLLANVRQMQQFQQGFYVELATGRNGGDGPNRGGQVGAAGLGLIAGPPVGQTGAAGAGGFFGLLQRSQQIRNQQANVAALRVSLAQLIETFDAGRIANRLQVDQARQALYRGEEGLLTAKAAYQTQLDAYKIDLGLPPDLDVIIRDSLLDKFRLNVPATIELQDQVNSVLETLRQPERISSLDVMRQHLDRLLALQAGVTQQLDALPNELGRLDAKLPTRFEQLRNLRQRPEVQRGEADPDIFSDETLQRRVSWIRGGLPQMTKEFTTLFGEIRDIIRKLDSAELDATRRRCVNLTTELSSLLLALSLDEGAARLELIELPSIHLDSAAALEIARENRLDWMNARARLVDAWRLIEFDGNALQSGLNIVLGGDIGTIGDNPIRFRGTTGQLRGGVAFDSPLTRLVERNNYRETQIEYQRARRDYMLFEDRINQSLRNTLRVVELSQVNFEIARASIYVSFAQVDLSRLRLNPPLKPGEVAQIGATTARDLLSALNDLLNSQNDLLNIWVNYEVLRMVLAFELGLMQLDDHGLWVDPGVPASSPSAMPKLLPPPEPVPPIAPGEEK